MILPNGGISLLVELHQEGFAFNGATQSHLWYLLKASLEKSKQLPFIDIFILHLKSSTTAVLESSIYMLVAKLKEIMKLQKIY